MCIQFQEHTPTPAKNLARKMDILAYFAGWNNLSKTDIDFSHRLIKPRLTSSVK